MKRLLDRISYGLTAAFVWPAVVLAEDDDASPLAVVMSGRTEATASNLTESGLKDMSISAANIAMYVSGAAGILVVTYGIYYLWALQKEGEGSRRTALNGVLLVLIGGLLTIPAVMAAIAPYAVLGEASD